MIDLLPPPEYFWPFWLSGIALNLTPGADMTIAVVAGARGGARAGLAAAMGTFTGSLVHMALAILGVSALLITLPILFDVLKWLGVAYLVYIAWQLLSSAKATTTAEPLEGHTNRAVFSAATAYRQALIINVLNPKVALFFLAFLPQFVAPGIEQPWLQILALGLVFNVTGTVINSVFALMSAGGAAGVTKHSRLNRIAKLLAGGILLALALQLALQSLSDFSLQ